MMKVMRIVIAMACVAALSGGALAQPKGSARIKGKVVDDQGKPAEGVAIQATLAGQPQPLQTTTNNKGEFELKDMAAGQWEVTFAKDGFAPMKNAVELKDRERIEGVEVTLAKAVDPTAEINAELQRAASLAQGQKIPEARKIYEDLLAKYPTVHQLHGFIARTYAAENQIDKAIEHMRVALEKEPENEDNKLLLGDLLMEKGDKAAAQQTLESVDMTKVKDPLPFINLAISQINEKRTDEALALLNKLLTQFPEQHNIYYYRGRAYVAANKLPEAKADLEKFVAAAAPDARELPDAKKVLEQLKDIK
jgi:predicted Zn-dependent protease